MAVMQASEANINFVKTRLASPDGNLWNLPKPGMVLIKPTSIANSGGSATLGENGQVTFSSVTSVSLNNVFNSSFQNYIVSIRSRCSLGGESLRMRLRSNGSDASASNYTIQFVLADGSTVSSSRSTSQTGAFVGNVYATQRDGWQVAIYAPFLAQPTGFTTYGVSGGASALLDAAPSTHSLSNSYDGLTLYISAQNMTGALQVYGVRS